MKQAKISKIWNIPRPYSRSNWIKDLRYVDEHILNIAQPKIVSKSYTYSLISTFYCFNLLIKKLPIIMFTNAFKK